jgi:hypothetical protein
MSAFIFLSAFWYKRNDLFNNVKSQWYANRKRYNRPQIGEKCAGGRKQIV